MEIGKTGIPWVPWDPMEMGVRSAMVWEWELSAWEWELRRGGCHQQLRIVFCSYTVAWSKGSNELPGENGRDSGIAGWENKGMGFKFHMGMGMKSLKWEGIGTKNLFPHTSTTDTRQTTAYTARLGLAR